MSVTSDQPRRRITPFGVVGRLLAFAVGSVIAGVIVGLMLLPFAGAAGVVTRDVISDFESLPVSLSTPPLPERSVILASDGSLLATLYYQNRVEVPLNSIAPVMRQAIIAIEDARFLEHNGVDARGVVRALARNTTAGGIEQGSSTLTMQYIKNVLVNQATSAEDLEQARGDSFTRKIREARLALALEKRFSKSEILARYLNIAYFGSGAYGVEAAARRYFSKPAADLNLSEAATLAGIVKGPTAYDPLRNPENATQRRNVILQRMASVGFISSEQSARAAAIPMEDVLNPTRTSNGCTSSYAPFFCDYVLQTIRTDEAFGETPEEREAFLRRGGYTIRTTLDPKVHRSATDTVNEFIPTGRRQPQGGSRFDGGARDRKHHRHDAEPNVGYVWRRQNHLQLQHAIAPWAAPSACRPGRPSRSSRWPLPSRLGSPPTSRSTLRAQQRSKASLTATPVFPSPP